jgi:CheY-like chemotaxis protein
MNNKKHKILVVEDVLIAQKIASIVLTQLNYEVDIAANGLSALEKFAHNEYDVIFMDIGLPDTDGFKLTHEMREQESTQAGARKPAVIIALTAHDNDEFKESCKVSGMNEYMLKPLSVANCSQMLQKFSEEGAIRL